MISVLAVFSNFRKKIIYSKVMWFNVSVRHCTGFSTIQQCWYNI